MAAHSARQERMTTMGTQFFEGLLTEARDSSTLSSRQKHDLLALLEAIGESLEKLAAENAEAAQSIRNFLACAVFESTRRERTSVLAATARKGMLLAFRPYEDSHAHLVSMAYTLGDVLSALGV